MPPRYLHRITPGAAPGKLRVVDEHGFAYLVDLSSRTARALGRPDPARVTDSISLPTRNRGPHRQAVAGTDPRSKAGATSRSSTALREGLYQRTGLLSVTDEASHQRLDVARIYDGPHGEEPESDAGDVFFVSAGLDQQAARSS